MPDRCDYSLRYELRIYVSEVLQCLTLRVHLAVTHRRHASRRGIGTR